MNLKKRSVVIAWSLSLFCLIGASANLVVWALNLTGKPSLFEIKEVFGWGWIVPVLFSVLAALIIANQPGNRVGWLLMLPALVTTLSPSQFLTTPPETLTPGVWLLLWFDFWSWIPVLFPIFLILLHFPTGRPPTPKWNWVNWLAGGLWLYFILLVAFKDTIGPLSEAWTISNPIGFIPPAVAGGLAVWFAPGLVIVVLASVISLIVRYRRAQSSERQQIKWLLYAGALFVSIYILQIVLGQVGETGTLSELLLLPAVLTFPVAITIAILRYRLYDIDLIIRKTITYTVLSGLLALVYFGLIVLLQSVFESVSGAQSPFIIVISTLVIAALFTPLRRRVQDGIDRRFFRKKYDAQQVLARFAQTARDETDMETLTAELTHVVQETMQPERVSVWLKEKLP